jgi:hypothetical protein
MFLRTKYVYVCAHTHINSHANARGSTGVLEGAPDDGAP